MIKTNTRRRVVSVLLALVMLVSLMPSLVVPSHAFWDDYDDGFDCPNCDHYHFGSDYMCDCLFCTIDCNYECWVETHCNDCGVCFGDTPYWCEECYKCAECMEEKHCSTCAKCYIGEDDQLCGECYKCPCCSITICDSCGFCDDCANDDNRLDLQVRIAEIDAEFRKMLDRVFTETVEAFDEETATRLMNEKSRLQQKLDNIADAEQRRENAKSRLDDIYTILDSIKNRPMEYDDQIVRQLLECIVVESKEQVTVIFKGGLKSVQPLTE